MDFSLTDEQNAISELAGKILTDRATLESRKALEESSECIDREADRKRVISSTQRTTRWLQRCLEARDRADRTALFGIVQGGFHADLRVEHARVLRDLDLDGYAIGGLSVGEGRERMLQMLEVTTAARPVSVSIVLMRCLRW